MRTTGAPHQEPEEPRRSSDPLHEPGTFAGLRRIWRSQRPGVAITRDLVLVALVIGALIGGLWAYSGQSLDQPPIVVVESGSMMHPEAPFGRIGTIDPGDLVLVKQADTPSMISTAYERETSSYGGYGDVIVFRPMGDESRTPIIHRVLTWVDAVPGSDGQLRYDYRNHAGELVTGARSVDIPEVGIVDLRPPTSGFVTKGDNPRTNHAADPITHTDGHLVEAEWLIGIAKGQVPWIGLVKLSFTGNTVPLDASGHWPVLRAWAPWDTWVMLALSVAALLLVPLGLEALWKHNATMRRWTS